MAEAEALARTLIKKLRQAKRPDKIAQRERLEALYPAPTPVPVGTPREFRVSDVEFRGLTLWRPWTKSIVGIVKRVPVVADSRSGDVERPLIYTPGPKRIENRDWHIFDGLAGKTFVLLQSGKVYDKGAETFLRERGWESTGLEHPDSVVEGMAFLEDEFGDCDGFCNRCPPASKHTELQDDPFYMGGCGWIVSGVVPFLRPVPAKGDRKLWRVKPELLAACLDAYFESVNALQDQLEPGPRLVRGT